MEWNGMEHKCDKTGMTDIIFSSCLGDDNMTIVKIK